MKKLSLITLPLMILCLCFIANTSQAQSWTGTSGKLYANPTTTKVAIGTSSPTDKYQLTVRGTSTNRNGLYATGYTSSYYAGYFVGHLGVTGDIRGLENSSTFSIYANSAASNGPYFKMYGKNNNSRPGGMSIVAYDQGTIEFFSKTTTSWAKHMTIRANGKISIGTSAAPTYVGGANVSAYKLFVKGGILSDEIRVRTGWADYVFADDYQLTSLSDVEQHIEQNGYLHNTPSAEQVEAEGIEIGEMTKNQQEKIEEVFLHLIALEKRIGQLEMENNTLKAVLNQKN